MKLPQKAQIPCFLCGKPLPVKLTKKDKPYFVCDPCGLQVFVRCKPGIQILARLLRSIAKKDSKFQSLDKSSYQTLSLTTRLTELQTRLERARDNKSLTDHILTDSETDTIERALKKEFRAVKKELLTNTLR